MQSLFAPTGANFTLGRAPIGANDFATGWYSYDETPNDFALTHFSIDHDRQTLIPFIHAAMRYQPSLGIWAVPWSPPTWMKTNGAYKGGEMKDDPQTLASYALYFSKYIQAYRAEGINLYAVMPQNEPRYNNNVYPQAVWSGALMDTFLRDYLVPRLQQDKLSIQVWQGTIVNENLADYILPVLGDPAPRPLSPASPTSTEASKPSPQPTSSSPIKNSCSPRPSATTATTSGSRASSPSARSSKTPTTSPAATSSGTPCSTTARPAAGDGDRTACSRWIAPRSRSATTRSSTP